jgi:hypothetical protein
MSQLQMRRHHAAHEAKLAIGRLVHLAEQGPQPLWDRTASILEIRDIRQQRRPPTRRKIALSAQRACGRLYSRNQAQLRPFPGRAGTAQSFRLPMQGTACG